MRILPVILLLAGLSGSVHAQQATPAPMARPASQGANGDWGNLARYRDSNVAIRAEAMPGRVVFMGDSITEGWALQPFIKDERRFVGRGISGQTAGQMLVRFHADVVALKPRVVHIMAGTNDVARNQGPATTEEVLGYVTGMAEIARANGITVVLASVPPAAAFKWRPEVSPVAQIREINAGLKAYADRHRIVWVDYWPALATTDGAMRPDFSRDGVHPNAAGYAAMRPLAEAALRRAAGRAR